MVYETLESRVLLSVSPAAAAAPRLTLHASDVSLSAPPTSNVTGFIDVYFTETSALNEHLWAYSMRMNMTGASSRGVHFTGRSVLPVAPHTPVITNPAPVDYGSTFGTILSAADTAFGAEQDINNNEGLLRVPFVIPAGTPAGTYNIVLDPIDTVFVDNRGAVIPVAIDNGQIRINGGAATGSVSGQVYNDRDADGVKDSNETGLAGWRVFIDADRDGVFDSNERSVLTDASGNYRFAGLAAGRYRIREVVNSGFRATNPSSRSFDVTVAAGQNVTNKRFGNTQNVLISGTVFNDADRDGVKDSGEAGLSGWRVFIDRDNDGRLDTGEASVLTDSSGNYKFTTLAAGTYRVRVVQQSGWTRTAPSGGSYSITLAAGRTSTGRNFGERRS